MRPREQTKAQRFVCTRGRINLVFLFLLVHIRVGIHVLMAARPMGSAPLLLSRSEPGGRETEDVSAEIFSVRQGSCSPPLLHAEIHEGRITARHVRCMPRSASLACIQPAPATTSDARPCAWEDLEHGPLSAPLGATALSAIPQPPT